MRRFIQIVLVLLLLTAAGGSWYLYRKGFSRSWRQWVVAELRDHGLEVSFGTLAVEPFRGLVARDVKVYDGPTRRRVVAQIDEMVVEANYAHAMRAQPFLEALTLVDASLKLPLDPAKPDGQAVGIEKLNTRLLFQQDDVTVSRLEALVAGLRVSASGQFFNLSKRVTQAPPGAEQPPLLLRALAELQQVRHEGPPTQINVRFSGDLTDLDTVVLEVDLAAEKAHRNDYYLESLAVSAVWKNRALTFPRFDLRDSVGRLQLSLSHDMAEQRTDWHLRSSVDLPALARAFGFDGVAAAATGGIDLSGLKFQSVPEVEFTGRGSVEQGKPKWLVFGRVSLGRFAYEGVPFDRFHADISSDGRRWALRDFLLRHRNGGEVRGDAQQDYAGEGPGDFRLGLTSTINPEALTPLLLKMAPTAGERLALMRFHEAPKITLSARGPSPLDSAASGDLLIGRAAYRGMEAQSAKASLRYDRRVLYVDDFFIRRTEGTASGSMAFNFQDGLSQIKQVRCTVVPTEVVLWVDPTLLGDIKPYRFGRKPPALVIDGVVDQRRPPLRTHLQVSVDAPAMTYEFSGKDLHFTDLAAKLSFDDDTLKIADLRGALYGGTVEGDAQVSLLRAKPGHTADLTVTDVDFASLTKLYFDYDESAGKLNGRYRFSGIRDDARTMKGEGELSVTEGNVFAIPFLGPLSDILNKIVPGMGYNKARRASALFTIADGIISTKNLVIEGRGFSMIGDGRVWFLEDRMDFDMRINAQGLPGVLLFPVSKLLEVRAVSKFSKPEWRPKVIPVRRPTDKVEKPDKSEKPERPRMLPTPPR